MSRAIDLGPLRRPRRPSLTPLIDVVFLLLVFFMLAARFGSEAGLAVTAATAGGDSWQGPPRLVEALPDGPRLNGVAVSLDVLAGALAPLMPAQDSPVIVRAGADAQTEDLTRVLGVLQEAGIATLLVTD